MAGSNELPVKKKGGPGKPFVKGVATNPSGLSRERRELRKTVKQALDQAFIDDDGKDTLVAAIIQGVADQDSTCLKLACEYRWGKPTQDVAIDDLRHVTTEELLEDLPEAVATLKAVGK